LPVISITRRSGTLFISAFDVALALVNIITETLAILGQDSTIQIYTSFLSKALNLQMLIVNVIFSSAIAVLFEYYRYYHALENGLNRATHLDADI